MNFHSDSEFEKLQFVAQNFDPFSDGLTEDLEKIIRELQLEEFIEKPFELTNELLRRLHQFDDEAFKKFQNNKTLH